MLKVFECSSEFFGVSFLQSRSGKRTVRPERVVLTGIAVVAGGGTGRASAEDEVEAG